MKLRRLLFPLLSACSITRGRGFRPPPAAAAAAGRASATRLFGFLDGLAEAAAEAFSNDENLSRKDAKKGSIEGPGDQLVEGFVRPRRQTEVQKRWLESQERQEQRRRQSAAEQDRGNAAVGYYARG